MMKQEARSHERAMFWDGMNKRNEAGNKLGKATNNFKSNNRVKIIASGKPKIVIIRETKSVKWGQTQKVLPVLEEMDNENTIQMNWPSFQSSLIAGLCLTLHFTTISTSSLITAHTLALNNYIQLPEYDATLHYPNLKASTMEWNAISDFNSSND